uniref:Uncharacterized protein n=1 Tax=Meloidogyne incognita TaxID=6306 RepID=A0A914M004_MELIC
MFAFATNATRLALQRMNKLLNGENSSNYLMDQANKPVFFQQSRNFFWDAGTGSLAITVSQFKFIDVSKSSKDVLNELCSSQYSGLVCRDFDRSDIADGAWLKLSETERLRAAKKVGHWPYIVNNNFYVGVHNKMARQAINGLWFLTAKQKLCSLSKARRVLKKYEKV